MKPTEQKKLSSNRKAKFYEAFKVLYALHKGTYDIKNDPVLFGAMVDVYYRKSFSIPTEKFSEFMNCFDQELPSPFQWDIKMTEFLRQLHPDREEKQLPPMTDGQRNYAGEMMRAMSIPQRALKLYPTDGVDVRLANALLLRMVHDKYKKSFPSFWQNKIDNAESATLKTTKAFVNKHDDRLTISKGGFETIEPGFTRLFGPDVKDVKLKSRPKTGANSQP